MHEAMASVLSGAMEREGGRETGLAKEGKNYSLQISSLKQSPHLGS